MKCKYCSKEISKTRKWHKFCSDICRASYHRDDRKDAKIRIYEALKKLQEEVLKLK